MKALNKVTLQDHAEAWQKERGQEVPPENTLEYNKMYEEWIDFAFEGIGHK